jgi:outer membrane protein TolC
MYIAISTLLFGALLGVDTVRVSLDAAVTRALEANPSLRAHRATAEAAGGMPLQGTRAFLPSITLDLAGVRTNDPVAVFGFKLRQGSFAQGDFDLGALNNPDPYGNWTSRAVVEQPILAPEGLYGYSAAKRAADAQLHAARRAAGATAFFVTRTYWDAQLAARRVESLDTAIAAARAHAARAEAMREQGLVTSLDARLARLRASALEVQRLAARAQAQNALSALRTLLALPDTAALVLIDSLDTPLEGVCQAGADCGLDARADLEALRLGAEAAGLGVKQAWAAQLPSIAAFGAIAYHGRGAPWDTGSGDWTIGIGLKWPVFHALSGVGSVRAAKAQHQAALAQHEAAQRQAALEVLEATRLMEAAREGVAVAAAAAAESQAALDHARLRYQTGAAPITELLDVEAAAVAARLNLLAARRDLFVAQAALDFAYGVHDQ